MSSNSLRILSGVESLKVDISCFFVVKFVLVHRLRISESFLFEEEIVFFGYYIS